MPTDDEERVELRLTRAITDSIEKAVSPLHGSIAALRHDMAESVLRQEQRNATFAERDRVESVREDIRNLISHAAQTYATQSRVEDVANHVHELANVQTTNQVKSEMRLSHIDDSLNGLGAKIRSHSTDVSVQLSAISEKLLELERGMARSQGDIAIAVLKYVAAASLPLIFLWFFNGGHL